MTRRRSPRDLPRLGCMTVMMVSAMACGRKGPVRPPELVVPAPIMALSASNDADGITLGWPRPTLYADGRRMTDLGQFIVQRAMGDAAEFAPVAALEVSDRDRFRQVKQFRFADRDVTPGRRYRYRVTSVTVDGYESEPSNTVEIMRQITAAPKMSDRPGGEMRGR